MTSSPDPQTATAPEAGDTITWYRAHPGFILLQMLATLRSMVIPFIVLGVSTGAITDAVRNRSFHQIGIFSAILLVLLLVSLVWNVLEWRFFRYALTPQRLLVKTGWISRQERSVPYQRIQAADVVETPVYRVIGLARLRIETASGGSLEGSEVDIRAIGREEAMRVREHLLRERQASRSPEVVPAAGLVAGEREVRESQKTATEGERVRALSVRELLIAGATSGTIGPAAAVIGGLISFGDNVIPMTWWERVPWDQVGGITSNLTLISLLVVIVAVVAWLMAIAGTVITYYGFELRRSDEHLFVQHGLLDRRRGTIPINRIQAIRVEEGILRQPFGYVTVKYSSAGQGIQETGGSGMLFPFMRRRDVRDLLEVVAPEFAVDLEAARLAPLPGRALPRYVVVDTIGTTLVVVALIAGIWYWQGDVSVWWYLPLALIPFQAVTGWLAYRDAGWGLDGQIVMLRSRSLARRTLITTRRRIQHRRITANPLQRRVRLATLHVAIAAGLGGGTTSLAHIDRADGERLLFALNPRASE